MQPLRLSQSALLVVDAQQGFTASCPLELPVPGGLEIVQQRHGNHYGKKGKKNRGQAVPQIASDIPDMVFAPAKGPATPAAPIEEAPAAAPESVDAAT